MTVGDAALYTALYGSRFAVQFVRRFRLPPQSSPRAIDDLLAFHIVFGKSVPDVSLNAVANLGYADGRFLKAGLSRRHAVGRSEIIGLKENSSGRTGAVYVRTPAAIQAARRCSPMRAG